MNKWYNFKSINHCDALKVPLSVSAIDREHEVTRKLRKTLKLRRLGSADSFLRTGLWIPSSKDVTLLFLTF